MAKIFLRFFSKLKQFNIYRVAITYAIVAWLFIQMATQIFPFFNVPTSAIRIAIIITLVGLPVVLALTWGFHQRAEWRIRREESSMFTSRGEISPGDEVSYPIAPPSVPRDLIDACAARKCVLYAGTGLSAQSGLPNWVAVLGEMVQWAIGHKVVDERSGISLRAALQHGEIESVSEGLLDYVGDRTPELHEFLKDMLLAKNAKPSSVHHTLAQLPFGAVLTTNFDELLEESFQDREGSVYTPRDTEALLNGLSAGAFFILKLYGSLRSADTIILSTTQYEEAIASNRAFSAFMETLFFSRTILFLGTRLESIEEYLRGIQFSQTRPRTHYALVNVSARGPAWELKSNTLRKRYGIEVIPYAPTEGHPEVRQFVEELVTAVEQRKADEPITPTPAAPAKGALKRVILDNIGPFDHLELNLDPGWNIILGDNGVGKSSILKAIAVAICGRDAQKYANRLLKVDKGYGSIILETDRGSIYRTELKAGNLEAELLSIPGRPLEAEGWLAIGFPAARLFSWDRPTSPEARVERRPSPDDLLPLIQGIPDPRMDKVKQWLLNLDYWIKDARDKKEDWERYERLRDTFFAAIHKLATGTTVDYAGIESQTFEVKVTTAEGTLPLEALSQGTAALLGWIGILLQRLYEMPDTSVPPAQRYALVMIDELDAHMHPAWQQALIPHLKTLFPNIQFLATTHSPFLAVGRRASEIVRLARDLKTGKVHGEPVEYDTKKMGVANVLTSYLFGLESAVDYDLQRDLRRKRKLATKPKLTGAERFELASLTKRLQDVDAATMFRDPLYQRFVQEMTRRDDEAGEEPGKVTKESEQLKDRLTKEIIDRLIRDEERNQ